MKTSAQGRTHDFITEWRIPESRVAGSAEIDTDVIRNAAENMEAAVGLLQDRARDQFVHGPVRDEPRDEALP